MHTTRQPLSDVCTCTLFLRWGRHLYWVCQPTLSGLNCITLCAVLPFCVCHSPRPIITVVIVERKRRAQPNGLTLQEQT
jgi:hypothetical protein